MLSHMSYEIMRRNLQISISTKPKQYGKKRPTSASLETLMKTARGEFLSKNCEGNGLEERVLIQVDVFSLFHTFS